MAPSDLIIRRRRRRKSNSTSTTTTRAVVAAKEKATRPKRGQYKKLQKQHVHQQEAIKQPKNVKKESTMDQDLFPSTTNLLLLDDDDDDDHHHHHDTSSSSSGCCTPKAQRFRIPEIKTCPPAPKKQRVLSNCSSLMQRNPNNTRHVAFFAPPDLELFFFSALHDISV